MQKIPIKIGKRRGVAEIIGTLMLMSITVVGASILTYFVNDSFNTQAQSATATLDTTTGQIKLIAYDTRDSADLLGITNADNNPASLSGERKLCGESCVANPDDLPLNGGTEFFVIQFTNNSINSIFLHSLQLNYVIHDWDSQPIGYPHDGKFSILTISPSAIQATNEIQSGQTVNLLVKLDSTVPDVSLSKSMRVLLNIGENQPVEFLIESGNVI
jgi:flagellin-like protein